MKPRLPACLTAVMLLAAMMIPLRMTAQQDRERSTEHHKYKLIDLGTFGGPASYFPNGLDGILNHRGTVVGWSDTSTPDPYPSFCVDLDCFVSHAFQWQGGVLTDLGTLPGGASSQAAWISPNGLIAGISQNGQTDPLIPGFPEFRAVLWKEGQILDLGTLEGGHESLSSAVNSRGQVTGWFMNTIPDPFSIAPIGGGFYQVRAFLWQNGLMRDLGTLGGPDAIPFFVNERGDVSGQSYADSTVNPSTGVPTVDPFLWEDDKMLDLGTLGGTVGFPTALNNLGQVAGQSNLAGDQIFHPFVWTKNGGIQDLGTLGGNTGTTNWINDAGDVAGKADLPGPVPQTHDAVLWKNGAMTDLGTLPGDSCSNAYYVNSREQVVGTSENQTLCLVPTGGHAFLWEDGGPMVDLNTLIRPGSSLQLSFAFAINERGEIAGTGLPPGCSPQNIDTCGHAYVLIPCAEDDDGCGDKAEDDAAIQSNPVPPTPSLTTNSTPEYAIASLRARMVRRYRIPALTAGP